MSQEQGEKKEKEVWLTGFSRPLQHSQDQVITTLNHRPVHGISKFLLQHLLMSTDSLFYNTQRHTYSEKINAILRMHDSEQQHPCYRVPVIWV